MSIFLYILLAISIVTSCIFIFRNKKLKCTSCVKPENCCDACIDRLSVDILIAENYWLEEANKKLKKQRDLFVKCYDETIRELQRYGCDTEEVFEWQTDYEKIQIDKENNKTKTKGSV